MNIIFEKGLMRVSSLMDESKDYLLFLSWLSDLDVCQYYEGRTKPFTYEMVLEKFQERAKGIDPVVVGIVEWESKAIGFVQYYKTEPGEYHEEDVVDMAKYHNSYGMDIVIGDKSYWNKGLGTKVLRELCDYLFTKEQADIIFIAPQTWNERAIRTYEKVGFKKMKIIKNMELHDDEYKDGILMIKERS